LSASKRQWVAFDCETTGFLPTGRLIEISAMLFDESGTILDEFHALISPPVAIPQFITDLTGIST
jgi:DNA polymerase III epsilon subunit-like protein